MKFRSIDYRKYLEKLVFLILGVFFIYAGLRDTVYLQDLAVAFSCIHIFPKFLLLIFFPGLKLCLGGIFLFYPKFLKSAGMTAFFFILSLLTFFIYKALTIEICGVCGELKKHIILFNAWKPVVLYSIIFIFNFMGFFLLTDDNNSD